MCRLTVILVSHNKEMLLGLHELKKYEARFNRWLKRVLWHRKRAVLIESIPVKK